MKRGGDKLSPRQLTELDPAEKESEMTNAESERRLKRDVERGRMAARLRAEPTMTWRWIAESLSMGHWPAAVNAAWRTKPARRK